METSNGGLYMSAATSATSSSGMGKPSAGPRLFFLDLSAGRVLSVRPDGKELTTLVAGGEAHPDGIAIDPERGHLYWTNMGNPSLNDGSIRRSDLDGGRVTTIVPNGATFTPKQIQVEQASQKLYWCDREGMRVMRCDVDGANVETLVQTGEGDADRHDQNRWCVGIAVDPLGGKLYWTQKGGDNGGTGRIFRAGLELRAGETPSTRTDIELLFANLPEPIDLDLDLTTQTLYWTDRGDPPRGNTVNSARVGVELQAKPSILVTHLMEGIGLALDTDGKRMFVTDLAGTVYSANMDGSEAHVILAAQGNLTGIAYLA